MNNAETVFVQNTKIMVVASLNSRSRRTCAKAPVLSHTLAHKPRVFVVFYIDSRTLSGYPGANVVRLRGGFMSCKYVLGYRGRGFACFSLNFIAKPHHFYIKIHLQDTNSSHKCITFAPG